MFDERKKVEKVGYFSKLGEVRCFSFVCWLVVEEEEEEEEGWRVSCRGANFHHEHFVTHTCWHVYYLRMDYICTHPHTRMQTERF